MRHAQANRGRVSVLGCQKREMEKLKKSARDQGTPYNEGPSGRARHGINRMIAFLDRGLLLSVDDTAVAGGRTHADEIFFDYFCDAVKKGKSVRFVTNDGGLKLAMHEVAQTQPQLCEIIDRDRLIDLAEQLSDLWAKHENIAARLRRLQKVAEHAT